MDLQTIKQELNLLKEKLADLKLQKLGYEIDESEIDLGKISIRKIQ